MKKQKIDKQKLILLSVVGIILLVFSIAAYVIHNYNYMSSKAGTLGDALNGLTAPFIALVSAFLLYYSFTEQVKANKAQMEANKLIQSQWRFDTFYKMYNEIDQKYREIHVIERRTLRTGEKYEYKHYALGWIRYLIENSDDPFAFEDGEGNPDYSNLIPMCFVINDICQYIKFVKESEIPEREFFLDRINDYYGHNMENDLTILNQIVLNVSGGTYFNTCFDRLTQNMNWLRSRSDLPHDYELD